MATKPVSVGRGGKIGNGDESCWSGSFIQQISISMCTELPRHGRFNIHIRSLRRQINVWKEISLHACVIRYVRLAHACRYYAGRAAPSWSSSQDIMKRTSYKILGYACDLYRSTMEAVARWYASSGLSVFSHRLTKQLAVVREINPGTDGEKNSQPRNLVFSPLSVYTALSLAAAGAQGTTLRELLDVLGAPSRERLADNVRFMTERAFPDEQQHQPAGGPRIAHACGLWHDARDKLKPAYRDAAAASCKGVARAVDFLKKPEEAREKINSWVAAATHNLIDSILGPGSVRCDTRLVLTSAIYFKGEWETPFDKASTKKDKFHRLDGSTVDARFMRSGEDQFIATYDGFKVLKMPYKQLVHSNHYLPLEGFSWAAAARAVLPAPWRRRTTTTVPTPARYSMCVVLPDARDGLCSLEEKMASSPSGFLRNHMPKKQVEVGDFQVPRFKLSLCTSLKRVLQDLGIKAAFHPVKANMPDMLEEDSSNGAQKPLFVDDVLHKAVIEVNEEGTEAAAATAVVCFPCATQQLGPPPVLVDFVADHPFAFFVVEEVSGAVLFAGHVVDPTDS